MVASGGVSSLLDIVNLYDLGLYGAIAGKALYTGALGPARRHRRLPPYWGGEGRWPLGGRA